MKQLVLIFTILLTLKTMHGQTNALGLRLNGGTIVNAEISYQRWLGDNNRIEADLGFGGTNYFNIIKVSGIYQWCFEIEYPLAWYVGVGPALGYWNYVDGFDTTNDDGLFLNASGQIGIEYHLEIPLQISLDLRPELGIINSYKSGIDAAVGLSVRYTF